MSSIDFYNPSCSNFGVQCLLDSSGEEFPSPCCSEENGTSKAENECYCPYFHEPEDGKADLWDLKVWVCDPCLDRDYCPKERPCRNVVQPK